MKTVQSVVTVKQRREKYKGLFSRYDSYNSMPDKFAGGGLDRPEYELVVATVEVSVFMVPDKIKDDTVQDLLQTILNKGGGMALDNGGVTLERLIWHAARRGVVLPKGLK